MATTSFIILAVALALMVLACLAVLAVILLPSGWRPRRDNRGA